MEDLDMSGVDPLRWAEVRRRVAVIKEFLKVRKPSDLDRKLHADQLDLSTSRGIVSKQVDLADEDLAKALCEACSGVIGQLMNVARTVLTAAVRRGDTVFGVEDLSDAVEMHLMQLGFIGHNPLREL